MKTITSEDYYHCFFINSTITAEQTLITSEKHEVYSVIRKTCDTNSLLYSVDEKCIALLLGFSYVLEGISIMTFFVIEIVFCNRWRKEYFDWVWRHRKCDVPIHL